MYKRQVWAIYARGGWGTSGDWDSLEWWTGGLLGGDKAPPRPPKQLEDRPNIIDGVGAGAAAIGKGAGNLWGSFNESASKMGDVVRTRNSDEWKQTRKEIFKEYGSGEGHAFIVENYPDLATDYDRRKAGVKRASGGPIYAQTGLPVGAQGSGRTVMYNPETGEYEYADEQMLPDILAGQQEGAAQAVQDSQAITDQLNQEDLDMYGCCLLYTSPSPRD